MAQNVIVLSLNRHPVSDFVYLLGKLDKLLMYLAF